MAITLNLKNGSIQQNVSESDNYSYISHEYNDLKSELQVGIKNNERYVNIISDKLYHNGEDIINLFTPDLTKAITISGEFTAPCVGLLRTYGINVTGSTYINGVQVDRFTWHEGSWAGHAGCSFILSKGDKVTGTIPNGKFYPIKGAHYQP